MIKGTLIPKGKTEVWKGHFVFRHNLNGKGKSEGGYKLEDNEWKFFDMVRGRLRKTKVKRGEPRFVHFRPHNGYSLQVGVNASLKSQGNGKLGASTWFEFSRVVNHKKIDQLADADWKGVHGHGDINIYLKDKCDQIKPLSIEAQCTFKPGVYRYKIVNPNNRWVKLLVMKNGVVLKNRKGKDWIISVKRADKGGMRIFQTRETGLSFVGVLNYNTYHNDNPTPITLAAQESQEICAVDKDEVAFEANCERSINHKKRNFWTVTNKSTTRPLYVKVLTTGKTFTVGKNRSKTFATAKSIDKVDLDFNLDNKSDYQAINACNTGDCPVGFTRYVVSSANSDDCHGGSDKHSIWLPNFFKNGTARMEFTEALLDVNNETGEARLYGTARVYAGGVSNEGYDFSGSEWIVDVPLTSKTDDGTSKFGKYELKGECKLKQEELDNAGLWKYFSIEKAAKNEFHMIRAACPPDCANFTNMGPFFQMGTYANGKNGNNGASAWFTYKSNVDLAGEGRVLSKYNNNGKGDFNLDVENQCKPCGLYIANHVGGGVSTIYTLDVKNGEATAKYFFNFANDGLKQGLGDVHIALSNDASRIYYIRGQGNNEFGYIETATRNQVELGKLKLGKITQSAVSPDGHLFFTENNKDNVYVIYDVDQLNGGDTFHPFNLGTIKNAKGSATKIDLAGADIAFGLRTTAEQGKYDVDFYVATSREGQVIYHVVRDADNPSDLYVENDNPANHLGQINSMAVMDEGLGQIVFTGKGQKGVYTLDRVGFDNNTPVFVPFSASSELKSSYWGDLAGCLVSKKNCDAKNYSIVNYHQMKRKDGFDVNADRSKSVKALNAEDHDQPPVNFFSLGFGGNITFYYCDGIKTDGKDFADVEVVETSYNSPKYSAYPEKARVEVSMDGVTWMKAGYAHVNGTDNSLFDLDCLVDGSANGKFKFMRITDVTDKQKFNNSADGFDVDGVNCVVGQDLQVPHVSNVDIEAFTLVNGKAQIVNNSNVSGGFTYTITKLGGDYAQVASGSGSFSNGLSNAPVIGNNLTGMFVIDIRLTNGNIALAPLKVSK